MVETATFSIFHRTSPAADSPRPRPPGTEAASDGPKPLQSPDLRNRNEVAVSAGPGSPAPTDARARRRAAREIGRQATPLPAHPAADSRPASSNLEADLAVTMHLIDAAMAEFDRAEAPGEDAAAETPAAAPGSQRGPAVQSLSMALEYQFLGLANPLGFDVRGTLADAVPVGLSIGGAGIYRPDESRPAPWRSFPTGAPPDHRRTGLAAGTRVLTARGEIAVEHLVPGDAALTLRGPALLPILWIGRSLATEPPIHIDADAFGPGQPRHALTTGVQHEIFIEAKPVTARALVNGRSIRPLGQPGAELFHIDVGAAEILLVEGLPLASGRR